MSTSDSDNTKPGRRFQRAAAPAPAPAPVTDHPDGVRLSKLMSERGLCSRREADTLIEKGWVFVNGERVNELGKRFPPDVDIQLSRRGEAMQAERVTILLHKPVGYVSAQPEKGHKAAVELIVPQNLAPGGKQVFKRQHLKGLAPAGRLDIDSTGLLVLTQDGVIAKRLIGDDTKVEKEYLVRVEGKLSNADLARLNHGLELDGKALRPAKVQWMNKDQLRFILKEGRKRQIRRMCELVGLKVVGLKRVRIGKVRLGDLPQGQWRYLRDGEVF
ncbi:rRNA pseudouridine synthase [Nitrogeniibacter mangrovi]|uniref:Dual-specificity RNA pseudouridine synthase RluF n=1 Tax=Nitrogeniibacter mangrovi TaxID=2016596 RepID=A0A6C1B9F2_9RHOO|nr:pseudouridine synthase [Nitrogeniibacter mangrovi]QID18970.1 rRNA pseudouridine synthase [Nitrogeniibacter mangrovi]